MEVREPAYKTRQEVADVIASGGVWDALDGDYLKPKDMPDEDLEALAELLVDASVIYSYFEMLFVSQLPEIEPI